MSGGPNLNALMGNLQNAMGNAVGAMKQMGQMASQIEQLQKIVSLIQRGGNPMELLGSFAQQDPQAGQILTARAPMSSGPTPTTWPGATAPAWRRWPGSWASPSPADPRQFHIFRQFLFFSSAGLD